MGRRCWWVSVLVMGASLPGVAGAAPEQAPVWPIVFEAVEGIARINPDGTGRELIVAPEQPSKAITAFHQPDLSADGTKVVFVECYVSYTQNSDPCWLAAVNIDGSRFRRIAARGWQPRWSPDGRHIASTNRRDGVEKVVVIDEDGSNERILAEGSGPDWSPDGSTIVFGIHKGDPPPHERYGKGALGVVPADGSGRARRLTRDMPEGAGSPSWSPDGKTIAFGSGGAVKFVNPDGKLRSGRIPSHGRPAWSPDSRWITVTGYFVDESQQAVYPLSIHDLRSGRTKAVMEDSGADVSWS